MSAVLQPLEPFMPRVDFHVQIDEQINARVEALAAERDAMLAEARRRQGLS